MANYALVENNEITERHDLLPVNWRHISGLRLAKDDEEFLNSLGWYTVTKVPLFAEEGKQYIDGYEYKFEDNTVYETPIIKNADIQPEPTPKTPEELFDIALNELREKRDLLLTQSDWTQLADVQSLYSIQWKTNWANYRQELRDLPNRCISGEINIYDFVWPIKPPSADIVLEETQTESTLPETESQTNPNVGE